MVFESLHSGVTTNDTFQRDAKGTLYYSAAEMVEKDWFKKAMNIHADLFLDNNTSNVPAARFDTPLGLNTSRAIHDTRLNLNLTQFLGCATRKYCYNCKNASDDGNIYKLFKAALANTVVNESRGQNPRINLANEGSICDHIYKGPFYLSEAYAIVPFSNIFQYIANIAFEPLVKGVLKNLSTPYPAPVDEEVVLINGEMTKDMAGFGETRSELRKRSFTQQMLLSPSENKEREQAGPCPGYTTHDGLGDDGDDTKHSKVIENKRYHKYYYAKANFPSQQEEDKATKDPDFVDLVFMSHMKTNLLQALQSIGSNRYSDADVQLYMPETYNSRYVLPDYIEKAWEKNCT